MRLPTPSKFCPNAGIVLVVTLVCTSALPLLAAVFRFECGTAGSGTGCVFLFAWLADFEGFIVASLGEVSCLSALVTVGPWPLPAGTPGLLLFGAACAGAATSRLRRSAKANPNVGMRAEIACLNGRYH